MGSDEWTLAELDVAIGQMKAHLAEMRELRAALVERVGLMYVEDILEGQDE